MEVAPLLMRSGNRKGNARTQRALRHETGNCSHTRGIALGYRGAAPEGGLFGTRRLMSESGQIRPSNDLGRMTALALLSGHGRITARCRKSAKNRQDAVQQTTAEALAEGHRTVVC